MRWVQIREIVRALGLSPEERDELRRHGDLGDLADLMSDRAGSDELQNLRVSQILAVAHACGLNHGDVLDFIRDN